MISRHPMLLAMTGSPVYDFPCDVVDSLTTREVSALVDRELPDAPPCLVEAFDTPDRARLPALTGLVSSFERALGTSYVPMSRVTRHRLLSNYHLARAAVRAVGTGRIPRFLIARAVEDMLAVVGLEDALDRLERAEQIVNHYASA